MGSCSGLTRTSCRSASEDWLLTIALTNEKYSKIFRYSIAWIFLHPKIHLEYMFECLIFVLMGWIWNVMWDNWFVIQFNLIASSDERKVGIYFGGTEQKPAFFFSRSISSHPSNKYNHGSNNCLLLFVFYLVRLKKTNRKKATVRPSETIKKHQHQQQGPAVVLLSIYLFCCYVCWLSVLVEYTGCPIKTVISQNIFLDK